jgi:hypothetical protein
MLVPHQYKQVFAVELVSFAFHLVLITFALKINSRNFVFFLNTVSTSFSLLASFLRTTSSQTGNKSFN